MRKKHKKDNRAQEPEPPQGTSEKVIVRLHLSPERTEKLLKFLTLHERTIRGEGDLQRRRYDEAMNILADMLLEAEAKTID